MLRSAHCRNGYARSAASTTCFMRTEVVTEPTPPGTGVMASTMGSTSSNTASPAMAPFPPLLLGLLGSQLMDTSITTWPGRTKSFVRLPRTPAEDTSLTDTKFTLPDGLYYSDGSLGRLKIPSLGLSVKVYEDESLESLAKGAGHFKSTSCWDGNVGLAGHNRGVANHFGQIHTLENGDKITYTTRLGTRTYEVFYVGQIKETDFSRLGRTSENMITLITCVRNVPELRWCVQAREVQ